MCEDNLQFSSRFRARRRRRRRTIPYVDLVCTRWEINIRAIKGGKFEELIRADRALPRNTWHRVKRTNERTNERKEGRKEGRRKERKFHDVARRTLANVTSERETSATAEVEADVNSNVNFVPAQSHDWVGIINLNINISRSVNHVRVTPKRND